MHNLDEIIERIRLSFEAPTAAPRPGACTVRSLTALLPPMPSAPSIARRRTSAEENLQEARSLVEVIRPPGAIPRSVSRRLYPGRPSRNMPKLGIVHALSLGNGFAGARNLRLEHALTERSLPNQWRAAQALPGHLRHGYSRRSGALAQPHG